MIESANSNYNNRNSHWFRKRLGVLYIRKDSDKLTYADFENRVIKIQRGDIYSMTLAEKRGYTNLEVAIEAATNETPTLSFVERLKEKSRKGKAGESSNTKPAQYLNVDLFVVLHQKWSVYSLSASAFSLSTALDLVQLYLE